MSIYNAMRRWLDSAPEPRPARGPARGPRGEPELRADADAILHAAIEAVEPERLVADTLRSHTRSLTVEGQVWVAGFGRAAVPMARAAQRVLGPRIAGGVLVAPPDTQAYVSPAIDVFCGGHPIPDEASVAGSRAIRQLAREAGAGDVLICLVSGGGSALLTLPPDTLPLADVQAVTSMLLRAGVRTEELCCVRRHIDALKGGQLAREAAPARVLALVLSDVPGAPVDVVASGPVSPDTTRFADAVAVLKRHGIFRDLPLAVRGWLDRGVNGEVAEHPRRGDPLFLRSNCVVVGDAEAAAGAACAEATARGYEAQVLSTTLDGPGRDAGRFLAESARALAAGRTAARPPVCVVTAGSAGAAGWRRGRCQELALAAALGISGLDAVLVAAMASDGADDEFGAAGAIATGRTVARAAREGVDAAAALERGAGGALFEALGDRIESGATGTHVGDLQILLLAAPTSAGERRTPA